MANEPEMLREAGDTIIARLRQYAGEDWETTACYNGLRDAAADEIERLRNTPEHLASRMGATFESANSSKAEDAVERVARAIADANLLHWVDLTEVRREGFRIYARAAIAALTEKR